MIKGTHTGVDNKSRLLVLVGLIGTVLGGVVLRGDLAIVCLLGGLIFLGVGLFLLFINKVIPVFYLLMVVSAILTFTGFFWPGTRIGPVSDTVVLRAGLVCNIVFLVLVFFRRNRSRG